MLDTSADGLWGEVRRALEIRDRFLGETFRESIRRYCGPAYREGDTSEIDFENHAYAWISLFLPVLASGNPRIRARTPRHGEQAAFAKAVELAVNRNFELTDIKRTIEQLAVQWAFRYSVAFTSPEPIVGLREREDPPFRPTTKAIPLEHYIWDILAYQHAECRFQGHKVIRDRDSLLQEAEEHPERGWNADLIRRMRTDKANEAKVKDFPAPPERADVEFWEVWIPEIQLDSALDAEGAEFQPITKEGFHGTIFTVSEEFSEPIREPRPFWGPRDGPYTFSGYLTVPDEVVPLSPLTATAAQAEIVNAVLASAIENIKGYKRGVAVSSDSGNLDEILADFQDKGLMKIDALGKLEEHLKEIEILGLTPQHQAQIAMLRDLLERMSGITEAVQGSPESGVTATASSIASMSTGKRMGYMSEKFISGMVKPIAKKEAWYLTMDPRSRTPLGELAEGLFLDPKTGAPIEMPVLVGGPEHGDFLEDMDTEIQPISMRFTTEVLEAEQAASWEQFLLSTAPMIPQTPYVDWSLVYSRKAEQLGDPALARTIDVQKAMMMGQIQMAMTMGVLGAGVQPTSQNSTQPRLGVDMKRPQTPTLKTSEKPAAFTSNARQDAAKSGSANKGPRMAGASSSTK